MKLLQWQPGGFVLYYKRLESGTFEHLVTRTGQLARSVSWPELAMLVAGIKIQNSKQRKRYLPTAKCGQNGL